MDDVFSPNHYSKMKIEPIDVIEACGLGYRPGSALAYIMRAGHKGDRLADLKKAMNFLHREIYGTWYVEPGKEQERLEDEIDNRLADESLAEMQQKGESQFPGKRLSDASIS